MTPLNSYNLLHSQNNLTHLPELFVQITRKLIKKKNNQLDNICQLVLVDYSQQSSVVIDGN